MTRYQVVFTPEAQTQLHELYWYIAEKASPEVADRYTSGIIDFCESLVKFPHRGNTRNDVRPGLRVTNYKRRTVIAFAILEEQVSIIGVYYGGRSYERDLKD